MADRTAATAFCERSSDVIDEHPPSATGGSHSEAGGSPPETGDVLCSLLEFRVRYAETDQMRVVHHPKYFVWFENGRIDLLHRCGVDYAALERNDEYFPVVTCACKYHRPARFDDMVVVKTVIVEAEQNRLGFGAWVYDVAAGGLASRPLAKLYSLHAYAKGEMSDALPVPESILASIRPHVYTGPFFNKKRRRPPGF